jgi:hypothetical protein
MSLEQKLAAREFAVYILLNHFPVSQLGLSCYQLALNQS